MDKSDSEYESYDEYSESMNDAEEAFLNLDVCEREEFFIRINKFFNDADKRKWNNKYERVTIDMIRKGNPITCFSSEHLHSDENLKIKWITLTPTGAMTFDEKKRIADGLSKYTKDTKSLDKLRSKIFSLDVSLEFMDDNEKIVNVNINVIKKIGYDRICLVDNDCGICCYWVIGL